ncbi:MAG TPA: glycosyltransferase family 2 protein [Caproicibacter sp.]|nr:glycosyltransferase family 2 protein [Caproicibacter sp.]
MKANLHTVSVPKGKGPFHGHDIRLTIGMIVKNEEKTLDKCLSSLKPLLEAVPSELIITDTGSTDKTLEIVKKHTDHILNFEWCGDFSAARNTGLSVARGEWFMFIDGDEWFDDVTEIIDFFNSGECDRYWTAAYLQRNYADFEGKKYNDFHACRIFRMHEGIHFKNKVHEDIARTEPTKQLCAYVNHYGYIYHSEEERQQKLKRNLELLLEEVRENPEDLKAIAQLCAQYFGADNYNKAIETCLNGLKVAKKQKNLMLWMLIVTNMLRSYYKLHEYQELLVTFEQLLQEEPHRGIFHLDYFRIAQMAAQMLKRDEDALRYGEEYLRLYQKYEAGQLDQNELLYGIFDSITPEARQDVILSMGWSSLAQSKADEAGKYLNSLDFKLAPAVNPAGLQLCFAIADAKNDPSFIFHYYQSVIALHDPLKKQNFVSFAETYLQKHPEHVSDVCHAMVQTAENDDYIVLNSLRASELDADRKTAVSVLEWFARNPKERNFHYSDILYYAMREKLNIMQYLLQTDTDDLPSIAVNMQKQHTDFADVVTNYFDSYSFENTKGLYWSVCLLERAILSKDAGEDTEAYLKLFESYAENSAQYVRSVYRPEMYTASNIAALPRACRFGYYIGEALNARRKADDAGYLANLRAALKEYPIMDKPISLILERFEREQNLQEAKAKEFASLAKQVKQKIESLILEGNLEQAGQVTMQLAKLMPDDKDVLRFRKLTHTEPTMAELASRFPQ